MKASTRIVFVVGALCAFSFPHLAGAAETTAFEREKDALVTAVYAQLHNGYTRPTEADGSFKRQTYAVAKGGYARGRSVDPSIDQVQFGGIVRLLAPYLARQNYLPSPDKESADLMLVIHWGTTIPFNADRYRTFVDDMTMAMAGVRDVRPPGGDSTAPVGRGPDGLPSDPTTAALRSQADSDLAFAVMKLNLVNEARMRANEFTANLLGYVHDINRAGSVPRYVAASGYDDLLDEIEHDRYYVLIGAYDFQEVLRGKLRLVWSTRVSIDATTNRFDEWLPAMLASASRSFGEETPRLVRRYQRAYRVKLGELKSLGVIGDVGEAN